MKNYLITLLLILSLASCQSLSSTKASGEENSATNDSSKIIVATYSGGKVTLKDVNFEIEKLVAKNDKLKGLTFDKLNQEQKGDLIKEFVIKEISYKEAKRRDLDDEKDYKEALKNFEAELLKQKLILALAKEAVDEKDVKKNYDELASNLKDKKDIRISYIAVKTEKEAQTIYQILVKNPNLFSSQAKKKSLDREVAKRGGDLGFVMEDSLPASVVKQAKVLSKGQISQPIQINNKWAIIKLEDKRPAEIASYEKAKTALAQNLAKKAIEDFATKSFEKAQINILVK